MRSWDVIVVGGGIIGLSLSLAVRRKGAKVLIVERGEVGREASYAAAGMLADNPGESPEELQPLAKASAQMYPEFVHELQDESGVNVDLRDTGTLLVGSASSGSRNAVHGEELPVPLAQLEPALARLTARVTFRRERSVDPRALVAAAFEAAKHREVDISSGNAVEEILLAGGRAAGVKTSTTTYAAAAVVNCAGAWACAFGSQRIPTRPVKGQIFAVVGAPPLRHVVRSAEVYAVPRSDGRLVIGATTEDAGYDKRTDPTTIERLRTHAIALLPEIATARILEAWAGLRPGTPDNLPILGETATPGYFAATGHFRDGILLAPVTAAIMASVISGEKPPHDIARFSPLRFQN